MQKKLYKPTWGKMMLPYLVVWFAVCSATMFAVYELRGRLKSPTIIQTSTAGQKNDSVITSAPKTFVPEVKTQVQIIKN